MVVHYSPENGSNIAKRFLQDPYMYSGTEWKLKRTQKQLDRFVLHNRAFLEWSSENGVYIDRHPLKQIAVPALEPNHLIDQASLIVGKAWEQVVSMMLILTGEYEPLPGELVVIPETVVEEYEGKGSIVFATSDVGVRESIGGRSWIPRRNFYLKEKDLKQDSINCESLANQLISYYATKDMYGSIDENSTCIRAIDSALAFVEVNFAEKIKVRGKNGNKPKVGTMPRVTVYPVNSTVGIDLERHPLANETGREGYISYLIQKGADEGKEAATVLRSMHNRAGGLKSEDLYNYARSKGIGAEMVVGAIETSVEEAFMSHVEGFPYDLWRSTLLTLLTNRDAISDAVVVMDPEDIPCAEFAKQQYPPRMSGKLSVYTGRSEKRI